MGRKAKNKEKTQTEIQLTELQDKFLANPEERGPLFTEYFLLLKAYARSLTLKEIKSKIFLEPDRVDEVATEAVLKLLNQYRKEGWKVWGSFAGALRGKVVEALYEDAEEDSPQSLNLSIGENSSQELGDILDKIGASALWKHGGVDPQELILENVNVSNTEIFGVLAEAATVLPYRLELLFHAYLLLKLRRPKTRLTLPSFSTYFLDKKAEDAFELLLLEIRNRIATAC